MAVSALAARKLRQQETRKSQDNEASTPTDASQINTEDEQVVSSSETNHTRKKQKIAVEPLPFTPPPEPAPEPENILDDTCMSHFDHLASTSTSEGVIYRLTPGDSLVIQGSYYCKLISGSGARILGADVSSEPLRVLSPPCGALPVIESTQTCEILITNCDVNMHGIDSALRAASVGASTDFVIGSAGSFTWKVITKLESGLVACRIDPQWYSVPGGNSIVLGPKRVGKSTAAKFLVNVSLRHAAQVALLDIDVGQNECSPPGTMSLSLTSKPLLGPPCTHQLDHQDVLHFGLTTARDDPEKYIEQVSSLAEAVSAYNVPLVVNTPGWVKGLGQELLTALLEKLPVSQYVFLGDPADCEDLVESIDKPLTVLSSLSGPPPLERFWTPLDYRSLSLMFYFFSSGHNESWDFSEPLPRQRPYYVPWSSLSQVYVSGNVPYSHVLHALNGSIVSIFEGVSPMESDRVFPYDPDSAVPRNASWLGLGLIRTVDPSKRAFHILTKVDPERLQTSRVALAKFGIPTPTAILLDYVSPFPGVCGYPYDQVPFLTTDPYLAQYSARRRVRRNVMRRSQR